ncbi:hypothetical protein ALC57_02256, partial [Trachymyrmex cornetzi]
KRPKPPNRWAFESETETTVSAAKKLKSSAVSDVLVPENDSINYRILNFNSVFNKISEVVKCKTCGGNVKFHTESTRRLGFKVVIICDKCRPTDISSCPNIGLSYEINRRFKKKEYIGHVQKRMGARLRKCKKDHKTIGGKNKLTAKMIDKLLVAETYSHTQYFGLAIRRNFHSVEEMRNAVWVTFYHYSSTKNKPQHHLCPQGSDSWCEWQQAKANGSLDRYEQSYNTLPDDVLDAIRSIYKDLSNESLLKRCLGGYTQKTNESFNNLIWRIAHKHTNSRANIVEIATFLAVCLFNEGSSALLRVMNTMGITVDETRHTDTRRCDQADIRAQHATREARISRRLSKNKKDDEHLSQEDFLYGPGIGDYM